MKFILAFLLLSSFDYASASMAGKTLHLKGGVAVGDCSAESTEKLYTCKTPHSTRPMILTFDNSDQPYANWSQTYRIGDNYVRADFDIFDDGDSFDVSATLTVYGNEDRVSSATVTLKNLDAFVKINTSTPPLPSPQGMKVVDLTIAQ